MSLDRVWLIGCGNMGGAMLRRWIDSGAVAAEQVQVVNRADRALPDREERQTDSQPH